ncbi:keratin-associated protein 10-10 [Cynoglossus semilaevis]|uniref:keratin-associated protein 10-10 n=1 Tax=Cynoglossus semilaevis TaxID=244447 RepID=UPI0004952665|nr:keratin-associated protein 10-10-like [Cynoglossus semilaevis]
MVCSNLLKDTGIMRLLLVGLLMGSVSGQTTTIGASSNSTTDMVNNSTDFNVSSTAAPTYQSSTPGGWNSSTTFTTGMTNTTGDGSMTYDNIYCPSFSCVYSECYATYMSQNDTTCPANCFCQLLRQTEVNYVANCSASCAVACNGTLTNCSTNCCNTTGCLNDTFASMMTAPTTVSTTMQSTTRVTTTTTTRPPTTTADQSKICHDFTCSGATCYKEPSNQGSTSSCSGSELTHCQLKQGEPGQWSASCSTNCSDVTSCGSSTNSNCQLECCTATKTSSCLKLNGTLIVPNMATRGPSLHMELMVSLVGMLTLTLSL